jgi:hypothetical protein
LFVCEKKLKIFNFLGGSSKNWQQIELEIPDVPNNKFQVIFEGQTNSLILTTVNLGVDDVTIRTGKCRKNPGDCDFESTGFCSWINAVDDEFDWILQKGATPSIGTGPSVDQ